MLSDARVEMRRRLRLLSWLRRSLPRRHLYLPHHRSTLSLAGRVLRRDDLRIKWPVRKTADVSRRRGLRTYAIAACDLRFDGVPRRRRELPTEIARAEGLHDDAATTSACLHRRRFWRLLDGGGLLPEGGNDLSRIRIDGAEPLHLSARRRCVRSADERMLRRCR